MESSVNNLANIEALLNIIANGVEILGIALGGSNLLICWVPSVFGCKGYSLKLFFCSVVLIVGGLATPGLVNMSVHSLGVVGGILAALITSLGFGALAIYVGFLPTIIAFRSHRKDRRWIALLNCCFFIPFSSMTALIWAARIKPEVIEDGIDLSEHRQ